MDFEGCRKGRIQAIEPWWPGGLEAAWSDSDSNSDSESDSDSDSESNSDPDSGSDPDSDSDSDPDPDSGPDSESHPRCLSVTVRVMGWDRVSRLKFVNMKKTNV